MPALWLRIRSEMRARWRAVLLLAVVGGLAGGAVLTAIAGARRTETAYERMLVATDAPDFLLRAGSGAGLPFDAGAVARIPGVARAAEVREFYLTTQGPRETVTERASVIASGSAEGGAYTTIGRPKLVAGRLPRADDEILVSRVLEREGDFFVGDTSRLTLVAFDLTTETGIRLEDLEFTIVGIGVTSEQIAVEERRGGGLQMLVTPGFVRKHRADVAASEIMVRLEPGADRSAFARQARELAGDVALDVASAVEDRDRVERAVRPQVIALWIFAGVLALAALLVLSQAVGRQLFLDAVDDATLGALGLGRRQRFALGILRVLPVALGAGIVALVTAIAASPLMPLGPARVAEPDPGIALDALVLSVGVVVVVAVVLLVAAIPAARLASRPLVAVSTTGGGDLPRLSLAERLGALGAPPEAVAGTRFALEAGSGPTAVPTRATLTGTVAAATALVAAVVVAANLAHLVDTPSTWGASWQVNVAVAADPREVGEDFDLETVLAVKQDYVEQRLERSRDVAAWSVVTVGSVELDGRPIPGVGVDTRGRDGVRPSVVAGRLPRRADEVALGAETMDRLGVGIGDRVPTAVGSLGVVGESVLPRFQAIGGADEAALNRGAVLTLDGLLERSTDFFTRWYLVRLAPGVEQGKGTRRLAELIAPPYAFDVSAPAPPQDIEAIARVTSTPVVLAIVLALLALATLVHALATSVRRRRRDLAILVALGFTRRQLFAQVSATVAWQASAVTVVSLVVALPLGIAGGRWLSGVFSDELGAVRDLGVPFGVLGLVTIGALVVANLVAFVPGRLAARLHPAAVLRSE